MTSVWDEDETFDPRIKKQQGRPTENPFPNAEAEEDFAQRGRIMIGNFFVKGEPKSRLNFDFGSNRRISKTQFWAIIYIYYRHKKELKENLDRFLQIATLHFGEEVMCDRSSIIKNVRQQMSFFVTSKYSEASNSNDAKKQKQLRAVYRFVVKQWENSLPLHADRIADLAHGAAEV